jgi:hypothetical protein
MPVWRVVVVFSMEPSATLYNTPMTFLVIQVLNMPPDSKLAHQAHNFPRLLVFSFTTAASPFSTRTPQLIGKRISSVPPEIFTDLV